MENYFISIIIGYLFGSIPTAFILIKLVYNKDIRKEGTGIVGTMNSFEVTQSKFIGIAVLLFDLLKGVFSVLIVKYLIGSEFWIVASSGAAAVFGHCFPIWLRFKGGRGLATTAGVMLVLGWIFIIIWILSWTIFYLFFKKIHLSNIIATILAPIALFIIPDSILKATIYSKLDISGFGYFGIIVCLIILIKHIDYIKDLLVKKMKYVES